MKDRFISLAKDIAGTLELECTFSSADTVASLKNDDLSLHLAYKEHNTSLVVLTGVGVVPSHDKEIFYKEMLKWNNRFHKTSGFAYGLDPEQELITLQCMFNLSNASTQYIFDTLSEYLNQVTKSIADIESYTTSLILSQA